MDGTAYALLFCFFLGYVPRQSKDWVVVTTFLLLAELLAGVAKNEAG